MQGKLDRTFTSTVEFLNQLGFVVILEIGILERCSDQVQNGTKNVDVNDINCYHFGDEVIVNFTDNFVCTINNTEYIAKMCIVE
jgi:hypothetical protein